MKKKTINRHSDGSTCLEGTVSPLPKNFKPCCDFFEGHLSSCAYKVRFDWNKSKKHFGIADPVMSNVYTQINYCPWCGKKL